MNRNLIGIGSLVVGIMIFSTQDAILKFISGDYAVTQAMATRCIVALPILCALVQMESGLRKLWTPRFAALMIRSMVLLLAYTTYYMAFPALPLAEAIALFFTAPIIVTILSGPMLGEKVTAGSWVSLALGFIGVLIILQPGSGLFEPAALLSLLSAGTYALSMILARRLGETVSATVMTFYANAVYLVGAVAAAAIFAGLGIDKFDHPSLDFLVRPWIWPTWCDFLLMGACGVIAAFAMSLLSHAYRMAEANLVTVFEYTGMIWAPLWGFVVFNEFPRWTTFAGMLLIAAAGVNSARSAARRPAAAAQAPSSHSPPPRPN